MVQGVYEHCPDSRLICDPYGPDKRILQERLTQPQLLHWWPVSAVDRKPRQDHDWDRKLGRHILLDLYRRVFQLNRSDCQRVVANNPRRIKFGAYDECMARP